MLFSLEISSEGAQAWNLIVLWQGEKNNGKNYTMALYASAHISLVKAGKMATPGINEVGGIILPHRRSQ